MPRALLAILDGYGYAENPNVSAIQQAETPFIDRLLSECPHSKLSASGLDVGLPEGQFGNSEVGHLNIGAGRIVWQELTRVNKDIDDGFFFDNHVLVDAVKKARGRGKIHLMGLFSDGGVHSHIQHLYALLKLCKNHEVDNVWVHALTDGRDTSPHGGAEYVRDFEKKAEEIGTGKIASVLGRYYAMDRDQRWERTQKAYDLLVHGKGEVARSASEAISQSYDKNITDEFIDPTKINDDPNSRIEPDDVIIFFNIRGDRARQITRALSEPGFNEFPVEKLNLHYATFTQYNKDFTWAHVAYPPLSMNNTLGEYAASKGLKQLRMAETEKYPHVTYFFNGGVEAPNNNEDRVMVPSPKVATYDLQPEMSALEVTERMVAALSEEKYDLVILNFANPDMVGHTGNFEATVKAVETIDKCIQKVLETATEHEYRSIVIADHGNADCMKQPDGSPHTAHTNALVPFIVVNYPVKDQIRDGILADVAPSLLKLLELPQPEEMTGKALF